jgi:small-conductance mechanosensitive channel
VQKLNEWASGLWSSTLNQLTSEQFYLQICVVIVALALSWTLATYAAKNLKIFSEEPQPGSFRDIRAAIFNGRPLLQPLMAAIVLTVAVAASLDILGNIWLVRAAQGAAFIFLVYSLASHYLKNEAILFILKWVCLPLALLHIFGWLDDTIQYLDSIAIKIGNIKITLFAVLRTVVFGIILFWLGRISNTAGQRVIRSQEKLQPGSREVVS